MNEFKEIFLLLKQYVDQQKENITLATAESLTNILSALAIGFILILFGGILLLLCSFALAFLIGELAESQALGFGVLALIVFLFTVLFYVKRRSWIITPLCNLISRELTGKSNTVNELHSARTAQKQKVSTTSAEISSRIHGIMSPDKKPQNRIDLYIRLARNIFNIWQGVNLGMKVVQGFRSAFHHHK